MNFINLHELDTLGLDVENIRRLGNNNINNIKGIHIRSATTFRGQFENFICTRVYHNDNLVLRDMANMNTYAIFLFGTCSVFTTYFASFTKILTD